MESQIQIQVGQHDGTGSPHELDYWTIIQKWPGPTAKLPAKQTSKSFQEFPESSATPPRKRSHSLGSAERYQLDNEESHAEPTAGRITIPTTIPLRTNTSLRNPPEEPPNGEKLTRGVTGVMVPNLGSPTTWAPMILNPTTTPPLSAHEPTQTALFTGKTTMDYPTMPVGDDKTAPSYVGLENREEGFTSGTNDLWQLIQKTRLDNWSLRSKIHESRAELRDKQFAKAATEDALIQQIQKQQLVVTNHKQVNQEPDVMAILQLREECQKARNEYGPLEDDCNLLEDRLSRQEFRLARMEDEFYRRSDPGSHLESPSIPRYEKTTVQNQNPFNGMSPEEFVDMENHPEVANFRSKLGDLDLLREHFDDLLEEQESLNEEKDSLSLVNRALDGTSQKLLDKWPEVRDNAINELRRLEDEVSFLRQECFSKGLIDEYDDPTNIENLEQASFSEDNDINSQDHISEYVKYPSLLPRRSVKEGIGIHFESEPDDQSDNSPGRVNQWLLYRLRSSAMDVMLLASISEDWLDIFSGQWEILVLDNWYNDDTVKSTEARVFSSSMSTRAPVGSDVSTLYHH